MVCSMINGSLAPPALHGNPVAHCLTPPQQLREPCFTEVRTAGAEVAAKLPYVFSVAARSRRRFSWCDTTAQTRLLAGGVPTGKSYRPRFHSTAAQFAFRTLRRKACARGLGDGGVICAGRLGATQRTM